MSEREKTDSMESDRQAARSLHETDLRGPLRADASADDLEQIVRDAVWRKELKHRVGEKGFRQPARTVSAIGGLTPAEKLSACA